MNVAELILERGDLSAPAILQKNAVVTYSELQKRVDDVIRRLGLRDGRSTGPQDNGKQTTDHRVQATEPLISADERLFGGQQEHGRVVSGQLSVGERIGIFSENSPFFVSAYLGIMKAGMVVVPFQTEIGEETFGKIVREAGIRSVFVSKRFERKVRLWAKQEQIELIGDEENEGVPAEARNDTNYTNEAEHGCKPRNTQNTQTQEQEPLICANQRLSENSDWTQISTKGNEGNEGQDSAESGQRLAALMFTSGSTGEPKGVMITHRNIECNTRDIIEYMGLTAADRCMVVLPFHYCFGLSLLHTHLMVGGSVALNNDFRLYPETVLRELQEKECTGIAGVPSTYQILLRKSRFRQMSFPKLRWFQQAGGKLPNPCIQEIRESFPQVKYFLMYGQTEATARLSYLAPERLADKLGSIGKGLPSTNLQVLKSDGTPVKPTGPPDNRTTAHEFGPVVPLSRGPVVASEIGEIVAQGDNISPGYWNDPKETVKYFRNGKLYTGDLARVDEDGFIYIVERERDMIKSGGNRVSAKEIEDVIAEIPEVVEVAVVGAPHELLGESIVAFVVVHSRPRNTRNGNGMAEAEAGITEADVLMHCRKRLPAFKSPEEVVFLKTMPHNSAGKVLKKELKQMAQSPKSQV